MSNTNMNMNDTEIEQSHQSSQKQDPTTQNNDNQLATTAANTPSSSDTGRDHSANSTNATSTPNGETYDAQQQPVLNFRPRFSLSPQTPSKKFNLMLNKLDFRNYDKVVKAFDYTELVKTESSQEIAHIIYNKVKSKPLYSEIYCSVLTNVNTAWQEAQTTTNNYEELFDTLLVMIQEQELSISHSEVILTKKLSLLKEIPANQRSEAQKIKVADRENKQVDMKKEILVSFKFIADMIHYKFLGLEVAENILETLFEINHNHIDFLNLGKLVIMFCTLANKIYDSNNPKLERHLVQLIQSSQTHIDAYNNRERLASETMINDLRDLHNRKFLGVYEIRFVLIRIYQTVYGFAINLPDIPSIMFRQNH
eukprot:403366385